MQKQWIPALIAWLISVIGPEARSEEKLTGLPDAILREVQSVQLLPKGRYTLVKTWEAEGKESGHQIGRAVRDPEANGGSAWEVRVASAGGAEPPGPQGESSAGGRGHLLYGPYIELPPADYVAFFRIKLLDEPGEDEIAVLDACVAHGNKVLGACMLTASDLVRGQYVQAPLGFRYERGKLECRMATSGYASLRVDAVWLYRLEGARSKDLIANMPQPRPSGRPSDLDVRIEPRPYPDVFPRSSPPAAHLLVADLRPFRGDWQLCLISLQGIVNRTQPQLYCISQKTDLDWLDWMRQRGWIKTTETIARPQDLLGRFRDRLKGMIITDPLLPATKNVATMMAGVKDGVVVSPQIAPQVALPVLDDLRGRWQTSLDAYRWAYDHLWNELNHHLVACTWPNYMGLRDYLVQHKAIIFWLPGRIDGARKHSRPNDEVRLVEEMLARLPVNIPVMGYSWAGQDVGIGEGPGVTLMAEFGKYLVGSNNCANLSVHSGIRGVRFEQRVPPPPRLDMGKVYVSVIISDGDNLPVLTNHNFPQLWKDPLRGQFPLGWTISPSVHLLIPDIADYYYSTATPQDCFLGAVSGIGYTYPDFYGKRFKDSGRVFEGFLDQTRAAMEQMGLKEVWIMGVTRPDLIQRYAERIPFLEAIFPDYGRRVTHYEDATYPIVRNVAVFHAVNSWKQDVSSEEQIAGIVSQIRGFTPKERPAFLHLFIWNWGFTLPMIREVLQQLGQEYVAVRPDHMAALYRQYLAGEQIMIRLPSALAGIEGQALSFGAWIHNVSDRPMNIRVRIASGMEQVTVNPNSKQVPAGASLGLDITGIPSADVAVLECQGPFGVRRSSLACERISREEVVGALPEDRRLRFVRLLEAEQLSHRSGKEEKDLQANSQSVWSAIRGQTEAGHIVYGPYAQLPSGKYLALFRLKRTGEDRGLAAVLDTCIAGGDNFTRREVRAEELPIDKYRAIPIEFRHPGGAYETRVFWPGTCSLSVDYITLWELLPF